MNTISIIHPTRHRSKQAFETHSKWMSLAESFYNIEYILSVDTDDPFDYEKIFWQAHVLRSDNKTAIEAINRGAEIAEGDLLLVVSDDFDCFEHWDTALLRSLRGREDFIVKTQDGIQKTLITLPIMDRKYYERFGYIYHPDYLHMHCDEEMTIVGHMLGRVINLNLEFPHLHYTVGGMEMDPINIKNNQTWAHGQATLDRRALDNFGIENPLVRREDIVWK